MKKKKILACTLVPFVAINLFAGCRKNTDKEIDKNQSTREYNVSINENYQGAKIQEEVAVKPDSTNTIAEEKDILKDKDSLEYIQYLSSCINKYPVSMKDVNDELHFIMNVGIVSLQVTEDTREVLFPALSQTVSKDVDIISYYYPLAKYVHLQECSLAHENIEEEPERVTCATLEDELYNELNDTILYTAAMINEVKSMGDAKLCAAINRIVDADADTVSCFAELENVYACAMIPQCMDEETWKQLFGNLMKTVGEYENVCEVYYDLACAVHMMTCEEEHEKNEFGQWSCNPYTLRLEK